MREVMPKGTVPVFYPAELIQKIDVVFSFVSSLIVVYRPVKDYQFSE
jgi:hypothetical protein